MYRHIYLALPQVESGCTAGRGDGTGGVTSRARAPDGAQGGRPSPGRGRPHEPRITGGGARTCAGPAPAPAPPRPRIALRPHPRPATPPPPNPRRPPPRTRLPARARTGRPGRWAPGPRARRAPGRPLITPPRFAAPGRGARPPAPDRGRHGGGVRPGAGGAGRRRAGPGRGRLRPGSVGRARCGRGWRPRRPPP